MDENGVGGNEGVLLLFLERLMEFFGVGTSANANYRRAKSGSFNYNKKPQQEIQITLLYQRMFLHVNCT